MLSKKSGIYEFLTEEHKDTIDLLEPLNIEALSVAMPEVTEENMGE